MVVRQRQLLGHFQVSRTGFRSRRPAPCGQLCQGTCVRACRSERRGPRCRLSCQCQRCYVGLRRGRRRTSALRRGSGANPSLRASPRLPGELQFLRRDQAFEEILHGFDNQEVDRKLTFICGVSQALMDFIGESNGSGRPGLPTIDCFVRYHKSHCSNYSSVIQAPRARRARDSRVACYMPSMRCRWLFSKCHPAKCDRQ